MEENRVGHLGFEVLSLFVCLHACTVFYTARLQLLSRLLTNN